MPTARIDPRRRRVTHRTGLRINAYARARENGIGEACPIRHATRDNTLIQPYPLSPYTNIGGTP